MLETLLRGFICGQQFWKNFVFKFIHHFAGKGPYSQCYGSPVVMCRCESWTIKKAENQIDTFELWCWRRLLRNPWTARKSNQSILKEINPEYSLKGLMLKLKLQYFGHLMWRADSLEKTLMLGKIEGKGEKGGYRGWDGWMASPTQWTQVWANSGQESLACYSSWGHKESDITKQLNNNNIPTYYVYTYMDI